jgi:hypothetical protein
VRTSSMNLEIGVFSELERPSGAHGGVIVPVNQWKGKILYAVLISDWPVNFISRDKPDFRVGSHCFRKYIGTSL